LQKIASQSLQQSYFFNKNTQKMSVKIRLQRKGRKKAPYYHIVVADARSPRDGKCIDRLGFYNPLTIPATIDLDREKALDWVIKGAQPTETARAILRFKGVLYHKHLLGGLAKGALTEEQVASKLEKWLADKDVKINTRKEKVAVQKEEKQKSISGTAKVKAAPIVEAEAAPTPIDEEVKVENVTRVEEVTVEVPATIDAAVGTVVDENASATVETAEEGTGAEDPELDKMDGEGA